ncbi:MAG TPA: murein transglycosylase [Campylobacterales bacterium]|nr:murein transglycosylase [Campylobacterales bacterium]
MKIFKLIIVILFVPLLILAKEPTPPIPYNYLAKKEVRNFIDMMVKKYHFDRNYITEVIQNTMYDRETLSRYTGKYKVGSTNGSWERYKAHVLDPETLQKAKEFKQNYYPTLLRAEQEYGVDMDYIVGFMGVESKYGTYTGDYRILDALATLAFHKNRMKKFFKSEFKNLFLLMREENRDIYTQYGSFAGAMGAVQQVPSIQRRFAMDYNGDGVRDPWDLEDCIGVIAKFMHSKGWQKGKVVAVKSNFNGKRFKKLRTSHKKRYSLTYLKKKGIRPIEPFGEKRAYLLKNKNIDHDDIWLGGSNFRVLTKYNNSTSYGMAIHLIAQSVKDIYVSNR